MFVKLSRSFPHRLLQGGKLKLLKTIGFLSLVKACAHGGNYAGGEELGGPPFVLAKGERGLLGRAWKLAKFLEKTAKGNSSASKKTAALNTRALSFQDSFCSTRHRSCRTRLQRTLEVQTWAWETRGVPQGFGSVRDLAVCEGGPQ